jgi:drug/metabolite transporter (DMT)-like permease
MVVFTALAFMLSYDGFDNQLGGIALLLLLASCILTGVFSLFQPKLWNKAHAKESGLFHVSYRNVAFVLIILYFSLEIGNKLEIFPPNLDQSKFVYWLGAYALLLMPNITYIFLSFEPKTEQITPS